MKTGTAPTHLDELSDVLRFDGVRISSAELGHTWTETIGIIFVTR